MTFARSAFRTQAARLPTERADGGAYEKLKVQKITAVI